MKAILYTAKDKVEFGSIDDPVAGSGEVVIAVKASGICHTDFEVLKGNYGASAFPLIPGHEYAGEIVEVGSGVSGCSVGDRVAVDPNFECGTCRSCGKGWAHLCEKLGAYGVRKNGGFAEFSAVDAGAITSIGDLSYQCAALAEPLGCALNGVDAVYDEKAENALIFGAGPMGMLLAICLKSRGLANITLADIDDSRLERATSFGFDVVLSNPSAAKEYERGVDLVVDATGVPAVAAQLTNYMADGGTGLFFGVCPAEARIEVSPFDLFRRQLKLVGTHSLNHNIPDALKVCHENEQSLVKLVSHQLSLEEIAGILGDKPPEGSLKVQAVLS